MNDETPAWAKDFKPRQNAPKKQETDTCPTCGHEKRPKVDYDDDEALRKLARHQLAAIIDVDKPTVAHTQAIRELIDRLDGKAPQSIAMTVKADPIAKWSTDRLEKLEREWTMLLETNQLFIAPPKD